VLELRDAVIPVRSLIAQASVIVLARVTAVEYLGPSVSRQNGGVRMRLWKVHANVEYEVKGGAGAKSITFYVHSLDPRFPVNGSYGRIWPPTRGIFFLFAEKGLLREVVDLYESHLDFSGPLPNMERFAAETPAHKIAVLFMEQPGNDTGAAPAESPQLALGLYDARFSSRSWTTPFYARRLLFGLGLADFRFNREYAMRLLTGSDRHAREAACAAIVEGMFGDVSCLASLACCEPELADALKLKRQAMLAVLSQARQKGETPPLFRFANWLDLRDPTEVRYFLETLASNRDQVIASSARIVLKSLARGQ